MGQDDVRQSLNNLNKALEQAEAANQEQKVAMDGLQSEVREALAAPESTDGHSLLARLEASLAQFEVDHPVLADAIQEAIASLSNAGV